MLRRSGPAPPVASDPPTVYSWSPCAGPRWPVGESPEASHCACRRAGPGAGPRPRLRDRGGAVVQDKVCIQASRSAVGATTASQIVFRSRPYSGRFRTPGSLAHRIRSSARARRRCRSSRSGSWLPRPAGGSVGGERGNPPPVHVGDAQLRAGIGAFPTDDWSSHATSGADESRRNRGDRTSGLPGVLVQALHEYGIPEECSPTFNPGVALWFSDRTGRPLEDRTVRRPLVVVA
jgi:hypothetical protein